MQAKRGKEPGGGIQSALMMQWKLSLFDRSTHSPGYSWSPVCTKCNREHRPLKVAAPKSHTPGPTFLMLSWWSPKSAAL